MAEDFPRLRVRRIAGDVHRIIPSRYPPVGLFDRAKTTEELADVFEVEALTNARLRQELGRIDLVPRTDWIVGPGTTPIMAAFCHPNRDGSRFSDGSYGVYYASTDEDTAMVESAFHRARFLRKSVGLGPTMVEMRRYITTLEHSLKILPSHLHAALLSPDPALYGPAQSFGGRLRGLGAWGLCYDSVRRPGGRCVAVLRPPALRPVQQTSHYKYHWDGVRIDYIERLDTAFRLVQ